MKRKRILHRIIWLCGIAILVVAAVAWLAFYNAKEHEPRMEVKPNNTYRDTLVVAADLDYQPYSFYVSDKKAAGYDVELIYLLANKMKMNVEVRLMQWTDAKAAVKSGEADILMGIDYNVEYLKEYELSMPLDNDPFVAFGKQGLSGIEEFYNKKIATIDGSGSFPAFLTPYLLENRTNTFDSYSEAFQSVERGENDYAIAMYSVGRRAIANLDDSKMEAVGPVLAGNYLCIGTNKGNTVLQKELNHAIIALKKEGELDWLGEKWLGRYVEVISASDFIQQNRTMLVFLIALVLLTAACMYGVFNQRLVRSTSIQHELTKRMLAYQQVFTEATKGLYENICEVNITNNRMEGESTLAYFESLGVHADTPFDKALMIVAETQLEAEFLQGYIDTFSTESVLQAYQNGEDRLMYEFKFRTNDEQSCWMRVTARIFYWEVDGMVRMIAYRVNIDDEKRKELNLQERVQEDSLTGLYNKITTGKLIQEAVIREQKQQYAFLMLDIDNFKVVNDTMGHAFGDYAIIEFANVLKQNVADVSDAIVGRIGGDEFAIFLRFHTKEELKERAEQFISSLNREVIIDNQSCLISASIGIAVFPDNGDDFESLYRSADEALYQVKRSGKNGYRFR